MIHRRSTLYLRQRQKYLQLYFKSWPHITSCSRRKKCCFIQKKMRNVSPGTSVNRVISLPHTRCILYSLCLAVPHFSQLSVNLTSLLRISENIFQIWSKSVGYEKLSGRFEPIRNGFICEWITIINISPNISNFLLLHQGTVLVWLRRF